MSFKRGTKVFVNMYGSVLHNAIAVFVRRNNAGSVVLRLSEDRGAYRTNDELTVGPGEFSELLTTTVFK